MVFLLFLLVPRSPSLRIENVAVEDDAEDESPLTLSVNFRSHQPTAIHWKKLELDLLWQSEAKLAVFKKKAHFKTNARDSLTVKPALHSAEVGPLVKFAAQCLVGEVVTVKVKAKVETSAGYKFDLSSPWTDVLC